MLKNRKKILRNGFTLIELIGVVIILGLIALIAFPVILNSIRSTKDKISDASKKIVYEAARLYVSDNSNEFFKYNGNTYCVNLETLSQQEYLPTKVYDSVSGDEIPLTNVIEIKYEQDRFDYNFNNDCVQKILYGPLITVLLQDYDESNTVGLLKDTTNPNVYYYKGTNDEVANNHLWYGGYHWRVIEFDTLANTLTLISQQPLTAIQPASAVWDTETEYNASYVNKWLNDYFYNSLDSSIQNNILDSTFNVGIYTDVDEITATEKVGLLDETQYTRAGGANSYLDIKDEFWFGNRYNSSRIRQVTYTGYFNTADISSTNGVRPIIKISDLTITEGDGTLTSNYKVGTKATNTNDVQVGEYINVPYNGTDNLCGSDNKCTFRVVSKDEENNRIKVVLNGLLLATSAWAEDASDNIQTTDIVYTGVLTPFINNIDSKYITNGTYGVGMYEMGDNYTVPQATTITANVGLPTIGEIFSGNDIDLSISSTKTFVDVTIIENPTVSIGYWTMNRYDSSYYVHRVSYFGNYLSVSVLVSSGVRPTIYLKSGTSALTFTAGEGTAQEPYELQ